MSACSVQYSGANPTGLLDKMGPIWEFPKIRGTILGVPILRIIVYWGPPILGNYHSFCNIL